MNCCDFSYNGKYFVAAGGDKSVYVYDEQTRGLVTELNMAGIRNGGHQSKITAVKFDEEDENVMYTGSWDRTIKIYDVRQKGPVATINDGTLMMGCDALDVNGDNILCSNHTADKQLSIVSISQRRKIVDIEWEESKFLAEGAGYLFGAKFSTDG